MENMASKSVLTILAFFLLVGSLQSGLAQWSYAPVARGPIPGDNVYSDQKGLYECFLTFYGIAPSCITEIINTVATGRIELGPACCNLLDQVKDECWKVFFPTSPDLPPTIKKQCDEYKL
ncbi:uncharacterized protein LOC141638874 [Silene latifolia]|uniref:uncharacterized protein LOC141638874 n=1 Tax=Silene latifolia TaxID=37657 RepID=UPI003D7848EF